MSNKRKPNGTAVVPSHGETMRRFDAVVARFQQQIANQVESINRLLEDPDAAAEIVRLQERIAQLETTVAALAGEKITPEQAIAIALKA